MKVVVIFIALVCSFHAHAVDIASCSDPSGKGYFPEIGLVGKKDSGWSDEKITGGITKVAKLGENEYDVLFVDVRKDIVSARLGGISRHHGRGLHVPQRQLWQAGVRAHPQQGR